MRLYFSFILFTFSIISFSEPRLGKDFFLLNDPLPVKQDGIVEVTEVFWYGCGHCYAMESKFKSWNKTQPDYVNFQKMPVTWGPVHKVHANIFYTIEAMQQKNDLHAAVFSAIHNERNFLSSDVVAEQYFAKMGVDIDTFQKYFNSFGVKQRVSRADKLSKQFEVTSVPMIIVDGKYKILAKPSHEETFEVLDYVINLQKDSS